MFLPLSDAPNPQRVPWMTYALIAANVAVFVLFNIPLGTTPASRADPRLAEYVAAIREALPPDVPLAEAIGQITAYDLFVFEHGFRPAAAEGIDLLTSMFLHGGFMHLFGNMLFLWIYGDNVEYRLGRLRYLLAYLATGVAATLFFTLLSPGSTLPLVGASGAISGVLGFYFLWFPLNVVRVLVFLFPILMRVFEIPARIVLGVYLVWDNIVPLLITAGQGGGGVAHGAHIGGFVAGLAGAWVIDRATTTARPPEYRVGARGDARPQCHRGGDRARRHGRRRAGLLRHRRTGPAAPRRHSCARRLAGDARARRRRAHRLSPVHPRSWPGAGRGRGATGRGARRTPPRPTGAGVSAPAFVPRARSRAGHTGSRD